MERLLTITDLCQRYIISKWTVYQWTAKGEIPFLRIGGQLRFRIKDLEGWEGKNFSSASKIDLL
jgi:excisionase family DNA binding protein